MDSIASEKEKQECFSFSLPVTVWRIDDITLPLDSSKAKTIRYKVC